MNYNLDMDNITDEEVAQVEQLIEMRRKALAYREKARQGWEHYDRANTRINELLRDLDALREELRRAKQPANPDLFVEAAKRTVAIVSSPAGFKIVLSSVLLHEEDFIGQIKYLRQELRLGLRDAKVLAETALRYKEELLENPPQAVDSGYEQIFDKMDVFEEHLIEEYASHNTYLK